MRLKILLIAPIDPVTRKKFKHLMGGENTYTRMLLDHPPAGVEFIHYEDALRNKRIAYHPLQYVLLLLQKLQILPLGPRVQTIQLHTAFDLIYAHGYPVRIFNSKAPLVISDSSSNSIFLKYYLKWPQWRVYLSQEFKKFVFQLFKITDAEVNPENAEKIFVFSKWALRLSANRRIAQGKPFDQAGKAIVNPPAGGQMSRPKADQPLAENIKSIDVIYPGLMVPKGIKTGRREDGKRLKILFVGVWFERKGGRILLTVFRKLSQKYKNISLTILGELPADITIDVADRIRQQNFVSYRKLQYYYQTHHILVHIPPEIEGYGMAVPEAMSYGMCCIVSDICALPEFISHKENGLIVKPGSEKSLEEALEILLENKSLIGKYGKVARKKFIQQFSQKIFIKRLFKLFEKAVL